MAGDPRYSVQEPDARTDFDVEYEKRFAELLSGAYRPSAPFGVLVAWTVAICATFIAMLLISHDRGMADNVDAIDGWRPVQATVVLSETQLVESGTDTHDSFESTKWCPRIRYEYEIGGHRFASEGYSPTYAPCGDEVLADSIVARYPVGATVEAFADPAKGWRAVLHRDVDHSYREGVQIWVWVMLALVLGCFAYIVRYHLWRRSLRNPAIGGPWLREQQAQNWKLLGRMPKPIDLDRD